MPESVLVRFTGTMQPGEPFEFIEKLNVYEDYVPDAKPWSVEAETRALADICLLLFNSNEFIYVY